MRVDNYEYRQLRKSMLANGVSCVNCGMPANQVDHIFPVALGGTNVKENLQPMCSLCNRKKGAKLNYQPVSFVNRRWVYEN